MRRAELARISPLLLDFAPIAGLPQRVNAHLLLRRAHFDKSRFYPVRTSASLLSLRGFVSLKCEDLVGVLGGNLEIIGIRRASMCKAILYGRPKTTVIVWDTLQYEPYQLAKALAYG
jgi:hypothetical protein